MRISIEDNYRYELKFILSRKKAEVLKYRLSLVMEKDTFSKSSDGMYYIRSLYFDDVFNKAYFDKIDGVSDREKYRIRYYNFDDSFVTLELKGKKKNLSYKKRDVLTKEECYLIINKEYDKININNRTVLNDFINKSRLKGLIPSVIVDYNRLAYTYTYEDVRITFDENIMSGKYNYDLFNKDIALYNVFDNDDVILEVKYNNKLPRILNDVIKTVPMVRIAVSKFALCSERKEGLHV